MALRRIYAVWKYWLGLAEKVMTAIIDLCGEKNIKYIS